MDRCDFHKRFLEITNIDVNFIFPHYQETLIFTCNTRPKPLTLAPYSKGQPRLDLTLIKHGANINNKEQLMRELYESEKYRKEEIVKS